MDEQQMISAIASSSNSSSMASSKKYDVFLSFRGEDTRRNFTSHLYKALDDEKVNTYIDNQLEKGDEISLALIKAIEDSHISIVIFSENYASSKWCLGELSKILECHKVQGQIVIPIFYNIEPTHVRKQTGSYEQAFAKHEREPRCNNWKAALTEVANLAGWDDQTYRDEPEFLKDIVEDVLKKLAPRSPNQHKWMIGIEENYEQIESLLKVGSSEVKTLGIWGMGGMGKTTISTALYDNLSYKFEGCCFLHKVRERSDNLQALRDELFSKLLGKQNYSFVVSDLNRLRRKKVFIVLDDVATFEQLETLIKEYDFLGSGSRVIVTTRNKQILGPTDEIYHVKELSSHHSLELFCLTAFGEKQPKDGFEDLSRRVVSYCKSVPLALKVLGGSLRSRSKKAWESELTKLQKIPKMEIHEVLKLSYDGLDRFEKEIFLDIACFFRGKRRDWVTGMLEGFGFCPESGIEALLDKALITTSWNNQIEMHDLLQEMGQKIVHQESDDPRRGSRLCTPEEVIAILKHNKGTDVVEGITFNLKKLSEDIYLSSDSLAKMTNMRFLQICQQSMLNNNGFKVKLPNDFESFPDKLRYLEWHGWCLESLPPNFGVELLVEIIIHSSKLKKLWDGVQNLANLKKIDLHYSRDLIETPDLSKAKKIKVIYLRFCDSLRQLHPSILSCPELMCLDLSYCKEIQSLNLHSNSLTDLYLRGCSSLKEISVTSEKMKDLDLSYSRVIERLHLHSKSLERLNFSDCSSLKEISVVSEKMTRLDLSGTVICALSSSMLSLPKLTYLGLSDNKMMERLSLHSKFLKELDLNGCSSLKEITVASEEMKILELSNCREIERLNVHSKSLNVIRVDDCSSLKEISVTSEEMIELCLPGCRKIESLNLDPKSLKSLKLNGFSSLSEISLASEEMTKLKFSFTAICALPSLIIGQLLSLEVLDLSGSNIEGLPTNLKTFSMLRELCLKDCRELMSLSELPPSLRVLRLDDCRKLISLPEFPPTLYVVSAINCISLETKITQQQVLRHMLQSYIPYLHQHDPNLRARDYFSFPGDHVMDKSRFCTTESSITIPGLPISRLTGFIYHIIFTKISVSHDILVSVYQDHIKVWDSWDGWDNWYSCCQNPISENMILWYHDISKYDRINEVYGRSGDITFVFEFKGDKESIKEFGVFPVYATESGFRLESFDSESIDGEQLPALKRRKVLPEQINFL